MRRLKDNPEKWSKEIQAAFYEEYPFFLSHPVSVNLNRKDVKKGSAIGLVTLGESLSVPVIVDNFQLKDFDTAVYNGKIIPLTRESIVDLFSNPGAFALSGDTMQDGKLTRLFNPDLQYPEDWGNNSRTSLRYEKTAALDTALSYIEKEDQDRILSFYTPHDVANFELNKTGEALSKILSADPVEEANLEKVASDNLERDRVYIHKIARDKYKLYMMNSQVDDPIIMDISEEERETLEPKLAERYRPPVENKEPKLVAKEAELLPNEDGVITDGKTHIKIAVTNVLNDNGTLEIEGLGKHFSHLNLTSTHVPEIKKIAEDRYLIPKNFKFYKFDVEGYEKVAFDRNNRVIKDEYTDSYTFQGPVFEKYASNNHEIRNVKAPDAYALAVQCGCCEEDLTKMAKVRRDTPFYFEQSKLISPEPMVKFVEKLAKLNDSQKIELDMIRDNLEPLLKVAAKVSDDHTVNNLLALGIVNEKSIKEFAKFIPTLEEVGSYLAKLLIMIRLGQKGIPEDDVEQAMEALSRVTLHLKRVVQTNRAAKELST